jgi:hypothetical protein
MASTGYVKAARQDPETNEMYFRLSISPDAGAKPGVGVEFKAYQEIDGVREPFTFAKGEIVKTNMEKFAFAKLDSEYEAKQSEIESGTPIQLKFPEGFDWGGLLDKIGLGGF